MKILKHTLAALLLKSLFFVSTCALLFVAGLSYRQIQSLTQSGKLVAHSYLVNIELEQLNAYAHEAESSQRGFLLTKDKRFKISYQKAIGDAQASIKKLKMLTGENPEQLKSIDSLAIILDLRFVWLENVVHAYSNRASATDTIVNNLIEGSYLLLRSQTLVRKIVNSELYRLNSHEKEYNKDLDISPLSIFLMVVLAFFIFVMAFLKINSDLKKFMKANNLLLINKEVFEQSEQIAAIGNWCWDVEKKQLTYSKNLYYLLGCEPDAFVPTLERYITFVHPDDRQLLMDWRKAAFEGNVKASITYRVIRKDGLLRYFKSIGKVITDNYGKTFVIGVNADIAEQQAKDIIIEEKVLALEMTNKELFAFNHIASHDLQEPLRKVLTFISRIRESDFDTLPEKVKDYLLGIERATTRMETFIQDLLLYSRANNVNKVFEFTDLNVLLENSQQELSQQIQEKKAVIQLTTALPKLYVIPFQIQQLFNNILSNSLKYSKPDVDPLIVVSALMLSAKDLPGLPTGGFSKFYSISFSDNGIGFEQSYADHIFTLFYRLHNKSEYSGTGVGLAICKLVMDNHKGFIQTQSIAGEGTTFHFYFPL